MQIVVPYTKLHPVTKLVMDYYQPLYVDVSKQGAYWELMGALWRAREPVIIVEHDIVPWPGALEELMQCPCHWGGYSYHIHGGIGIYHGLGCAKLTPHLMGATPDLWDTVTPWNELDQKLFFAARAVGIEPHHHRPAVTHLNERHRQ